MKLSSMDFCIWPLCNVTLRFFFGFFPTPLLLFPSPSFLIQRRGLPPFQHQPTSFPSVCFIVPLRTRAIGVPPLFLLGLYPLPNSSYPFFRLQRSPHPFPSFLEVPPPHFSNPRRFLPFPPFHLFRKLPAERLVQFRPIPGVSIDF